MSMPERTKQDICLDCNIFHITCIGELFERPKKGVKMGCVYQVKSVNNPPNKIQVAAFLSLYKAKRKGGMDKLNAVTEAIVHSSDEVFAKAILKRPELIKKWDTLKRG